MSRSTSPAPITTTCPSRRTASSRAGCCESPFPAHPELAAWQSWSRTMTSARGLRRGDPPRRTRCRKDPDLGPWHLHGEPLGQRADHLPAQRPEALRGLHLGSFWPGRDGPPVADEAQRVRRQSRYRSMAPGAGAGNQHRTAWEGFRVGKIIPGHMTPLAPAGDRSPGLETFRLPKASLPRMPGRPFTGNTGVAFARQAQ